MSAPRFPNPWRSGSDSTLSALEPRTLVTLLARAPGVLLGVRHCLGCQDPIGWFTEYGEDDSVRVAYRTTCRCGTVRPAPERIDWDAFEAWLGRLTPAQREAHHRTLLAHLEFSPSPSPRGG